ncbi:MAG: MFS transporter [Thermoplasmataceae archaeon]
MVEKKNLILATVLIGVLMSAIDTTIVILALIDINKSLNATFLDTIWVILIYLIVLATLTTQLGRLGDIFGRGRMFNLGLAVFIIGSAASGYSPSISFLISARAVQGFGAVLIQGNSNAIVADYFEPRERGRAFGITSMGWSIGATLGIVLGGIITSFIGWQYIFYINVPIGIIGLIIGLRYIKDNKKSVTGLDFPGTAMLVASLSLISYGAVEFAGNGLTFTNLVFIFLGLALIIPFIFVEKYVRSPMIILGAFREKTLSFSLLTAIFQAVGYLSVLFVLILYLQGIMGYSPLYSSLILVPGYVVSSMLAPKMGTLSDRVGARKIQSIGVFVIAAGVLIYLIISATSSIYIVVAGSIVSGFGGAMFWPSNNSAVMSAAPRELYGSISGLLRTLSNVGTLLSYVIAISVASISVPRSVSFEVFLGVLKLSGGISTSFMSGIHAAFLVSFVILVAGGVTSLVGEKQKRKVELESVMRPSSGEIESK